MPALLTGGLGFAPFVLITGGLTGAPIVPGPPSLLTGGLGFAPFSLIVRGFGAAAAPTPTPTSALYRDAPLLGLIADAVDGTRQFDETEVRGLPEEVGLGADEDRVAVLQLIDDASEIDSLGSNADGSVTQVRTVPFRVTIIVREQDPTKRYDELCRLSQIVTNVVNGQSFGGVTVPTMTRLRKKKNSVPNGIEGRAVLTGAFTYFVPSWAGRSEV